MEDLIIIVGSVCFRFRLKANPFSSKKRGEKNFSHPVAPSGSTALLKDSGALRNSAATRLQTSSDLYPESSALLVDGEGIIGGPALYFVLAKLGEF